MCAASTRSSARSRAATRPRRRRPRIRAQHVAVVLRRFGRRDLREALEERAGRVVQDDRRLPRRDGRDRAREVNDGVGLKRPRAVPGRAARDHVDAVRDLLGRLHACVTHLAALDAPRRRLPRGSTPRRSRRSARSPCTRRRATGCPPRPPRRGRSRRDRAARGRASASAAPSTPPTTFGLSSSVPRP